MQDQCDALPVNLAKAKPNAFKGGKKAPRSCNAVPVYVERRVLLFLCLIEHAFICLLAFVSIRLERLSCICRFVWTASMHNLTSSETYVLPMCAKFKFYFCLHMIDELTHDKA